jgi:hypothetical protein
LALLKNSDRFLLTSSKFFVFLSALPSAHEQIGSHRMDFQEIWYWCIRRKSVKKIKVTLRYSNNNRYFTWRPIYTFHYISNGFRMRKFSDIL